MLYAKLVAPLAVDSVNYRGMNCGMDHGVDRGMDDGVDHDPSYLIKRSWVWTAI